MKKLLSILVFLVIAASLLAFMMDDDDQKPNKSNERRISVERVLEAVNLNFHKEIGQTSIIFQFAPDDSIRIECEDCQLNMTDQEGGMVIRLQSLDKTEVLKPTSFGKWIRINSSNGKIGFVFARDGVGEKLISIRSFKVWRKTRSPFMDEGGVPFGLLDINNLYIDKLTKENTETQTSFFFKLKAEDKVKVDIIGANGAVPSNLICSMYKLKEEYDKKPLETGVEVQVPPLNGGQDMFGFEFAHIKDVKGVNAYHLDIFRIPLYSAGYLDIRDSIKKIDSIPPSPDTIMVPEAGFYEGPIFQYLGPEGTIRTSVPGQYNLGIGKNYRACFDITLSDEGLPAEPCPGCDTFWAFWAGVGNANINRYLFQDSTRKMAGKGGLIEAYARSMKSRGNSLGVFPPAMEGEKLFFAVVSRTDKYRFLTSKFVDGVEWMGNDTLTWSSEEAIPAKPGRLHYVPGSELAICICNQSKLSTIPVMFKFQQFLTVPRPKDSVEMVVPALTPADNNLKPSGT